MQKKYRYLLVMSLIIGLFGNAIAAPGDYDPTFGYGGAMQFSVPYSFYFEGSPTEDPPQCCILAQQADGKILMAGAKDDSSNHLVLRRFNTNGTLDTSYGFQGEALATHVYPGVFATGIPTSIKSLSNGKTIVAGYYLSSGVKSFFVSRYTSGGEGDTAFGSGYGTVTRSYSGNNEALALDEYRGTTYVAAASGRLYCFNSDGSACVGFGFTAGYITVPGIRQVAVQPGTNRLLASGYGWVKRYNLSGQLDTSFGNSGQADTCHPSCDSCARETQLAVRSNGKIVTTGTVTIASIGFAHYYSVSLLNSNGSADSSFGGNGCFGESSYPPFGSPGTPRGLDVQTDGKVLFLLGHPSPSTASTNENWNVVRLNPDGTADSTFSAQGTIARNQDLLVQSDGKIVTVGSTYYDSYEVLSDIFLGRYLP